MWFHTWRRMECQVQNALRISVCASYYGTIVRVLVIVRSRTLDLTMIQREKAARQLAKNKRRTKERRRLVQKWHFSTPFNCKRNFHSCFFQFIRCKDRCHVCLFKYDFDVRLLISCLVSTERRKTEERRKKGWTFDVCILLLLWI